MSSPAVLQNPTLSTPLSIEKLTPTQAQVAAALVQGRSVTKAAADAGIHRTTVYHWLQTSDDFRTAVEQATQEFARSLADELRDLSGAALGTLRTLLAAPDTPPAVRLKAALAILERPGFPQRGWRLPERIETPRQQDVLDGMAALEADYQLARRLDRGLSRGTEPEDRIELEP